MLQKIPHLLIALLILIAHQDNCFGAKILFYSVFTTNSHHMILHPLAVRLAQNGHEVTFLSSLKIKGENPHVTYFYPPKVNKFWSDILDSSVSEQSSKVTEQNAYTSAPPLAAHLCQILIEDEQVQDWLKRSTFDLVLINACFNECGLGLAHKFKAPHVIIQTSAFAPWHNEMYGIPLESSVIPDFRLNYPQKMNFFQRVYNVLHSLEMYLIVIKYQYFPVIEGYLRESLNDPLMPDIGTMAMNVRLVLLNSYFAAEYGRSLPPFVIPIGGMHCTETNETMPQNFAEFVNKFQDGFVYVSFGTMSKASTRFESNLLKILSKFPRVGFIVKWSGPEPSNPPGNILLVSWAPQQVLLAHPKIKAFVSHCGMLSIQEAAYYGVPIIATPLRADQDYNAECLIRLGGAVRLDMHDLSMSDLENAFRTILQDKYKKNMEMVSQVYRDRPEKPLETAIWWLEFVVRNEVKGNDLTNMQSLGMYQFWWQRRLLDVWGFLLICFIVALFLIVKITNLIIKLITRFIFSEKVKQN